MSSSPSAKLSPERLEEHRPAITGHCYRMLGSAAEADDAVQETMVRAWRSLDKFEERSSLRTWLYRIATNVCLDALADRSRRARPFDLYPVGDVEAPLNEKPRTHWLEPIPAARVVPVDADPLERAVLKESVRLAFVAALQQLPPRQRAALLLVEVLGWSAAEVADALDASVPAVNSYLQRARATIGKRETAEPRELTPEQTELLERYVDAFLRYDVDELVGLLREDATLSMPPYALWLRGREAVRAWLLGRGAGCRGSKLVPTEANGSAAFGQYRPAASGDGHEPWGLIVLELSEDGYGNGNSIAAWQTFLDTGTLFPLFGLPPRLP